MILFLQRRVVVRLACCSFLRSVAMSRLAVSLKHAFTFSVCASSLQCWHGFFVGIFWVGFPAFFPLGFQLLDRSRLDICSSANCRCLLRILQQLDDILPTSVIFRRNFHGSLPELPEIPDNWRFAAYDKVIHHSCCVGLMFCFVKAKKTPRV